MGGEVSMLLLLCVWTQRSCVCISKCTIVCLPLHKISHFMSCFIKCLTTIPASSLSHTFAISGSCLAYCVSDKNNLLLELIRNTENHPSFILSLLSQMQALLFDYFLVFMMWLLYFFISCITTTGVQSHHFFFTLILT